MSSTECKIAALQQAAQTLPEYAEIVPLFMHVYEYLQGREDLTGIEVRPPVTDHTYRIENRVPHITCTSLNVDRDATTVFLRGLIDVLSRNGKENLEYLQAVKNALQNGSIDPAALYGAILGRNRSPLNDASALLSVPSPLIEYIFELPLKTALESYSTGFGFADVTGWQESFCPICGSRAGMAELVGVEGRRLLSCSTCSFIWPFKRLTCAYCGCDDADQLSYFNVGEGVTRVDTCKACSRYIKTRDSRQCDNDMPLEIEDLLTIHLDLLAAREGFERGK